MDLIDKLAVMTELNKVANSNSKLYEMLKDKINNIAKLRPIDAVPKAELEEMYSEIETCFQNDINKREQVYKDVLKIIRKHIEGDDL